MEALKAVAEELNATLNQIVIAWLMHQNIIPIIGASRVEQIEQNLGCLDINLTEAQMKTLNRAGI
jgi:aryl-alcohol dehydrogenase-like predicted oxidoreductase